MQRPWNSERSTSAPPPDTQLYIEGDVGPAGSSYLRTTMPGDDKLNTLFGSRSIGRDGNHGVFHESSSQAGSGNFPPYNEKLPPGFSSGLFAENDTLSSSAKQHFASGGSSRLGSLDRKTIGENLTRSHSAAPPPGLARRKTPVVSNQSGDSYLEPAIDGSSILQLGQRRPASTGLIAESENSSSALLSSLGLRTTNTATTTASHGAVRPAAKTLIDLIQEDVPPKSPLYGDAYGSNYPRENTYANRPRTTSPTMQQPVRQNLRYMDNKGTLEQDNTAVLTEAIDRFQISQNDLHKPVEARPNPQYVTARPQAEQRIQGSIYAPVTEQTRLLPHPTLHPSPSKQFEQQPMFRTQPQMPSPQVQTHLQTQVLPSGHTVYVNAPPPQYGYATIQYLPHSQQQHIVHHTIPDGMAPHGEQYISIVPIHNTGVPVQNISPGGTYTYLQPDGQHGAHQRLAIVNAHGPGQIPVTITGVRNNGVELHRNIAGHTNGGRGKERAGKGRRGGTTTGRRGGIDTKHQNSSVCGSLLEEFKAKKNRDWTVYDIKGHVVEFCQDQNGSRFMQQRLEIGDLGEKEVVMAEVLPTVRRLRNDVFGNYVVQKLLDFGTFRMKESIRVTLEGEMFHLSLQMYGCRVVQKALETLDETDLPRLLKEFHNNVLSCIHDQNGNHVIQKCIEVMSEKAKKARKRGEIVKADFFSEQIDFIVDDVLGNVASLSCHPYGCRVLQRILEHCVEAKKSKALDEISKCHRPLLDDQYGNYVIQHVLQFGRNSDRDSILAIVVENGLLMLSRQKFASNVVEKLLKYGTTTQRKVVVREMLKVFDERSGVILPAGSQGTSVALLMVRDAYANYVVQTTLDVISECEEKELLLAELSSHSTELKNYTFAKHIVTKLGA